jgi:wyosine [tRNA(Phe)-imidazoG37] synthetase (radical SAM superfamily)
MQRHEYVPLSEVVSELDQNLDILDSTDCITIAGSGEPTLYSRLGDLITTIKEKTHTPIAVITNGSLLWDKTVQASIKNADVVIPSLDAGDAALFKHINRPLSDIAFDQMVRGLIEFREVFPNKLWLEVLLVSGSTAIISEVKKIAGIIQKIRPDKVQVNTVVRPPSEKFAYAVSPADLEEMAFHLGDHAEIIAEFQHPGSEPRLSGACEDILTMLKRRPCTLNDIVSGLGINGNVAAKDIDYLIKVKAVSAQSMHNNTFFVAQDELTDKGSVQVQTMNNINDQGTR